MHLNAKEDETRLQPHTAGIHAIEPKRKQARNQLRSRLNFLDVNAVVLRLLRALDASFDILERTEFKKTPTVCFFIAQKSDS